MVLYFLLVLGLGGYQRRFTSTGEDSMEPGLRTGATFRQRWVTVLAGFGPDFSGSLGLGFCEVVGTKWGVGEGLFGWRVDGAA
jgi:hypothetical protein